MPRGYMEGPAADEAERRLDELERGVEQPTEERLAVFGSTADDPEKHFIGWRDDVDPDELFASGEAWGLSVVRRPADSGLERRPRRLPAGRRGRPRRSLAKRVSRVASSLLASRHRRDFWRSTLVSGVTSAIQLGTWRKPSSSSNR